jgi:hypothetical protein
MLSKATLQDLDTIIKEDYGKTLTPQELFEIANTLVNYFDLLAKYKYENKNKEDYENKSDSYKNLG